MHPLNQSIHANFHEAPQLRRFFSLDNSSLLSSTGIIMARLPQDEKFEFTKKNSHERRLSLDGSGEFTNTTFLADSESPQKPRTGLDADQHSSNDSSYHSDLFDSGGDSSLNFVFDENDSDSDCDSFCDASIGELANESYIRRDLGASMMTMTDLDSLLD
mmetsp:Transcript_17120/g.22274  ORF Transcript_17120/g.22274 Transcript_17120/m.22274 type:complete len:160 (+) Transcript_17120:204-683(+)